MSASAWKVLAVGAAVVPVLGFTFGGWAVVTVDDLPEYAVAGQPLAISYTVRQHGMYLMSALNGSVMAVEAGSNDTVRALSRAFGSTNRASITLPHDGAWTLRISSGFLNNTSTLLPIRTVAQGPGVARPAALSGVERGHHLFMAKGCATCHQRGNEGPAPYPGNVGPILTGRQYPPAYVAEFLADPDKSPLSKATVSQWRMPNLGLKPGEISSLVAFINSSGAVASRESGVEKP